jgi:hypothetical protein
MPADWTVVRAPSRHSPSREGGIKMRKTPFQLSPSSLSFSLLKKIGNKCRADVCDEQAANRDTLQAISLRPAFNLDKAELTSGMLRSFGT